MEAVRSFWKAGKLQPDYTIKCQFGSVDFESLERSVVSRYFAVQSAPYKGRFYPFIAIGSDGVHLYTPSLWVIWLRSMLIDYIVMFFRNVSIHPQGHTVSELWRIIFTRTSEVTAVGVLFSRNIQLLSSWALFNVLVLFQNTTSRRVEL
jgi:hypothetical protein